MGTRSLTRVYDLQNWHDGVNPLSKSKDTEQVCMYKQFDGYPEGLGVELIQFMQGKAPVNGIPIDGASNLFNGPGCLAAQLIVHFKEGAGGVYIKKAGEKDCGEEFEYHISWFGPGIPISLEAYQCNNDELLVVEIPASK